MVLAPDRRGEATDANRADLAGSAAPLLDEVFERVALIDDDVSHVLLDHVLDLIGLVTGHNSESISLATDALILGEGHGDAAVAAGVLSAFARSRTLPGNGPSDCALSESGDLLVHLRISASFRAWRSNRSYT